MPTADCQRGFTLLELLVSLSLTAVVLGLLLSGLRVTEGGWRRGNERLVIIDRALAADEAIHAQVSSAVPRRITTQYEQHQWQLVSFRGNSQELRFVSNYSFFGQRHFGLWLVDYRVVRESGDKQQLLIGESPLSDDLLLSRFLLSNGPLTPDGFVFVQQADRIELSYLRPSSGGKPAAWVPEWKCEELGQLPLGVRIYWQAGTQEREITLVLPVQEEPS